MVKRMVEGWGLGGIGGEDNRSVCVNGISLNEMVIRVWGGGVRRLFLDGAGCGGSAKRDVVG